MQTRRRNPGYAPRHPANIVKQSGIAPPVIANNVKQSSKYAILDCFTLWVRNDEEDVRMTGRTFARTL
ncbi:MAG: hypothetical protein LBB84_03640 [Tannerellaceae bacterium]|nr:hypothetical protein [Tannerellaceae bacterium]